MTGRAAPADRERGVILPSVLIILALASAVVMMMISIQDLAIQRSRRFNEAAQANAYAKGGELSVMAALRRDGFAAPETDNYTEAWAAIAQTKIDIENGTFALEVEDAQAKFNINNLAVPDLTSQQDLQRIVQALRLPPSMPARLSAFMQAHGVIDDLGELGPAGLDPAQIAVLSGMADALPTKTQVNVNTADEALLAALIGNPATARQLIAQRERKGLLTADDVAAARALLPPGLGFTSGFFRVRSAVSVGDTAQAAAALLQRTTVKDSVDVRVIARRHEKAAPSPAPPSDR